MITPKEIIPSDTRLEVIGVLNPTFVRLGSKRFLIVRVDERPIRSSTTKEGQFGNTQTLLIARVNVENQGSIELVRTKVPLSYDPDREPILPIGANCLRGSEHHPDPHLAYVSHLRIAELEGTSVTVSDTPIAFPSDQFSQYGCEDPRAVELEGRSVVAYTAVGRFGATGWLANLHAPGILSGKTLFLGPDHKHTVLFPERMGAYYYVLTRPLTRSSIRPIGVWLFRSPDLVHCGRPRPLLLPRSDMWDSVRVGPATSPMKISNGWLFFYYGVDSDDSYHVGAALLDMHDPTRVIARSRVPILSPIENWERIGRRADIVFVCGVEAIARNSRLRLYYGAADTCVGAAEIKVDDLMGVLEPIV